MSEMSDTIMNAIGGAWTWMLAAAILALAGAVATSTSSLKSRRDRRLDASRREEEDARRRRILARGFLLHLLHNHLTLDVIMLRFLVSCLALMVSTAGCCGVVHAQTVAAPRGAATEARAKANEWTVGLAAGLPEDTFLPFAAEIARNLNESGNLRVLPLATPGAANNIKDLLFLNGIDVALTQTDVLHHLRTVEKIARSRSGSIISRHSICQRCISSCAPRSSSIDDLAGKKVGFNVAGAGPDGHRADHLPAPESQDRAGLRLQCAGARDDEDRRARRAHAQRRQAQHPDRRLCQRRRVQATADPFRQARGVLCSRRV